MLLNHNGYRRSFLNIAKTFDCSGMLDFLPLEYYNTLKLYFKHRKFINKLAFINECIHGSKH